MQQALPYVLGIAALALCLLGGRAIARMLRVRIRADLAPERIAPGEVPEAVPAALLGADAELEALGFESLGFMREAPPLEDPDEPIVTKLYARPETPAFALVAATRPEPIFLSLAEDGRKLATVGFAGPPGWAGLKKHGVIEARTASYTELWQRHQAEVAAQDEFTARDVSADELIAEWGDSARRATERELERGRYVRLADGRLRFGLRAASPAALGALSGGIVALIAALGVVALRPNPPVPTAGPVARAETGAPRERARAHLRAGVRALEAGRWAEASTELEAAGSLLEPLHERALESDVALRLGQLAQVWPEDAAPEQRERRAARHFERALDLREEVFGPESLEVAEVLTALPSSADAGEGNAGAAALIRQLRLVSIYERARAADGSHLAELLGSYEAISLLRADAGDDERAERALRRALEAATASGDAPAAASASNALGAFYLARARFAEARALEPIGLDRCWGMYWEGELAPARDCFAALGPTARLDLALVEARSGDADTARARLAEAGARRDDALLQPGPGAETSWVARERTRRATERLDRLAPLLGAL